MRFNRYVKVEITPKKTGKKITIEGLRVKFNVQKTIDIGLNSATIEIYNMNASNRASVSFKYNLYQQIDKAVSAYGGKIELWAGYDGSGILLFSGDMASASSSREGGDYLTTIAAKTKAEVLTEKIISKTFTRGTPYSLVVNEIIADLDVPPLKADVKQYIEQVTAGVVVKSGASILGTAIGILGDINKRFKGKISFNLDEVGLNIYGDGISAQVSPKFFFQKETGLQGAPMITNQGANLKVQLEPTIRMNDLIHVNSTSIIGINESLFVARSINHVGDSREGSFTTNLNTWYYTAALSIAKASNK